MFAVSGLVRKRHPLRYGEQVCKFLEQDHGVENCMKFCGGVTASHISVE